MMNRKDFDKTLLGFKIGEVQNLVHDQLVIIDDMEHRAHILAFWKSMAAIKGNLRSLSIAGPKDDYSIRTNRTQLLDGLDKIFSGLADSDLWYAQCKYIMRHAYHWPSRIYVLEWKRKNLKKTDIQFDYLKKIWNFCEYTDAEVLAMVTKYPEIYILYDGDDSMIETVGKMLL